jgi:single-strand DNA-binding protein
MAATKLATSTPTKRTAAKRTPTKPIPDPPASATLDAASHSHGASRAAVVDGHNEVVLGGRVSGEPTVRVLPSGDELVSWRIVVGRHNRGVSASGRQLPTVDTIDCVAFKASVRRVAARWVGGEVIEIRGELRRRFWRGVQGAASRCEVEVLQIRKIAAIE